MAGGILRDGVLATSSRPNCTVLHQPWPELFRALTLNVRDLDPFMRRDAKEPPHNRVQIWHLGLYHPKLPQDRPEGKGITAIRLLKSWNDWQNNLNIGMVHKVEQVYGADVVSNLNAAGLDSKYRSLMELATSMGLAAGTRTDFETPMAAVCRELNRIWARRSARQVK